MRHIGSAIGATGGLDRGESLNTNGDIFQSTSRGGARHRSTHVYEGPGMPFPTMQQHAPSRAFSVTRLTFWVFRCSPPWQGSSLAFDNVPQRDAGNPVHAALPRGQLRGP